MKSKYITLEPERNYNIYTLGGHVHTGRVAASATPGAPAPDIVYLQHVVHPGKHDLLLAIDMEFITAVEEIEL